MVGQDGKNFCRCRVMLEKHNVQNIQNRQYDQTVSHRAVPLMKHRRNTDPANKGNKEQKEHENKRLNGNVCGNKTHDNDSEICDNKSSQDGYNGRT